MCSQEIAWKLQIWPVSLSENAAKMRKIHRPWPKSNQFWTWSGHISMSNLRPFKWLQWKLRSWIIKTRQIWGIWKLRPAYSPETPNLGQNRWCFVPCDLEIWCMTLEKIGHLSFAVSSFVQHFIAIGEFKLELQSENAQFGSNSTNFRAVWPWNLMDDLEKQ